MVAGSLPMMPAIELVGIFTKPFALMIRLFANMMAGHAVILSLTCVIFVTVSGRMNGRLTQQTYANKVYSGVVGGKMRSAIQITTASSLCAMIDLLAQGALPQQGFVRQEGVALETFLGNRFGSVFSDVRSGAKAA